MRFVAVQGAHGLLDRGALHGAAVHAENWFTLIEVTTLSRLP